jgi:ATP-dependent DNA helicase RecG
MGGPRHHRAVNAAPDARVRLEDPLSTLKGIGPRRAADFARVGLHTVADLLARFPLRYEDRSRLAPIGGIAEGSVVTLAGTIVNAATRLTRRRGFKVFDATLRDETGAVRVVWLNQPYMADVLRRGQRVLVYGTVERRDPGGLQLTNPQFELLDDERESLHTGRIVPVYERVGTVTAKIQRRLIFDLVQRLPDGDDLLPEWLRVEQSLPLWRDAVRQAHFPEASEDLDRLNAFREPSQVRLILEEFFVFQAGLLLRRRAAGRVRKTTVPIVDQRVRHSVRAALPFRLTDGQKGALREIVDDMRRPHPMHRLLQGDVGAGKTIVALVAALVAMENGLQVAFMAPTEILAEQHLMTLRTLLAATRFRVALLTGAITPASRREALAGLAAGTVDLVVGTHALVQQGVGFKALGLAIIDEQHRFGVMQRATLSRKGWCPDVLVMTATPIPRTLALTTYGDLDISTIRGLPPGRMPVQTLLCAEAARAEVHAMVRREVEAGRQAYIVYPLVEESSKIDLRAATEMADTLTQDVFPDRRVALLHGRLTSEEKDRVMQAFAGGAFDILVCTSVIEVGIDVANASMIVIEHAERFGLAQLHQLRGRVGRGAHASRCVLIYESPLSDVARARLDALAGTSDGFVIAERDLALRGPGDFFGTRQSGAPTLRTGDLVRDHGLMEDARRYAALALEREGDAERLEASVGRTWADRFGLVDVG